MENNKYLVGLFDHESIYLDAIRKIRAAGVDIHDALTPFPVHGIEEALGLEDSRLHSAGFLFGLTGTTVALTLMTWISVSNYPLDIGGKPYFSLPAFIPITFELTVLFASVGMVITYCIRNRLFPGNIPRIFDPAITDDKFALTFELTEDMNAADVEKISSILKETGAVEVKHKEFEEDAEIFD